MATKQQVSDQDPVQPNLYAEGFEISLPATPPAVPYFIERVTDENGSRLQLTQEYSAFSRFAVDDFGTIAEFPDPIKFQYLSIVRGPSDVPPFPLLALEAGTPNMVPVFLIPADGVQSIIDPNTGYELVASAGADGLIFFAPAAKPEDALEWIFSGPNHTSNASETY